MYLCQTWEENHRTLLPKARSIPKVEAGPVNDTEDMEYVRGKVQEKNRLTAVRTRGLLGFEVRHGVPDGVGSYNVVEVLHDGGGKGRGMLVVWHVIGG